VSDEQQDRQKQIDNLSDDLQNRPREGEDELDKVLRVLNQFGMPFERKDIIETQNKLAPRPVWKPWQ
jgi:hypothetical protein